MITSQQIVSELHLTASRSSGAGGQNVNKVNSKVTLRWDVTNSRVVPQEVKDRLLKKWSQLLTQDGELILSSQEHRSQIQNRDNVLNKLNRLLVLAFKKEKVRKTSKPSKSSIKKRLESKRKQSEKKQWRKPL